VFSHCNLHDFCPADLADHLDTIVLVWVAQNQPRPQATLPIAGGLQDPSLEIKDQWIGLRENLQETMVFTIKYRAFL
jgi:hypothetical protein